MNQLTLIHLDSCPYCKQAIRLIDELKSEKPEYAGIEITKIEESKQPDEAAKHTGYWYVPSFFVGDKKLYEADPADKDDGVVKKKLDKMLTEALNCHIM